MKLFLLNILFVISGYGQRLLFDLWQGQGFFSLPCSVRSFQRSIWTKKLYRRKWCFCRYHKNDCHCAIYKISV